MAKTINLELGFLNKIEQKAAKWYKNAPHLSAGAQKWIATNIWWIVLVGAIFSIISVFVGIVAIIAGLAFLGVSGGYYYESYSYDLRSYSIAGLIASVVSLVFLLIFAVLAAIASGPLRLLKKNGWNILFLLWVIGIAISLLSALLTFSVFGFFFGVIFTAIFSAIIGYFLFEIRSYFKKDTTTPKK